jgi:hypothetical protein
MAPGVPASVTSLGPHGYSGGPCLGVLGCTNPNFQATVNFQSGTVQIGHGANRGGHHHRNGGAGYAAGYGYAYGYPYPVVVVPADEGPAADEEDQAEPPAQTIYERRPHVRPAPNPTPAEPVAEPEPVQEEQSVAKHHNMSPVADDAVPVVLVFKDGHTQEIKNYAIVGDTLYDLGAMVAHKIKMADVDVKTTIQKNEDRGVEFSVPAAYRPAA